MVTVYLSIICVNFHSKPHKTALAYTYEKLATRNNSTGGVCAFFQLCCSVLIYINECDRIFFVLLPLTRNIFVLEIRNIDPPSSLSFWTHVRELLQEGHLREVFKATGGPYGSTSTSGFQNISLLSHVITGVDEAFETLLFAVFGKELIDEFRRRRPAGTIMFNNIFGLWFFIRKGFINV